MKGAVYQNGMMAGVLEEVSGGYVFEYEKKYFEDERCPNISLSLPKNKIRYQSPYLFPFFAGLLPDGENRRMLDRYVYFEHRRNDFLFLLQVATTDTVGTVTLNVII
jgi:HipA-like protein